MKLMKMIEVDLKTALNFFNEGYTIILKKESYGEMIHVKSFKLDCNTSIGDLHKMSISLHDIMYGKFYVEVKGV